jgi:hypothetical protein
MLLRFAALFSLSRRVPPPIPPDPPSPFVLNFSTVVPSGHLITIGF